MAKKDNPKPVVIAQSGDDWVGRYGRAPRPRLRGEVSPEPRPEPKPAKVTNA